MHDDLTQQILSKPLIVALFVAMERNFLSHTQNDGAFLLFPYIFCNTMSIMPASELTWMPAWLK